MAKTLFPKDSKYCKAHNAYCEKNACLCPIHNEYGCFDYEYEEDGETKKIICTKDKVYGPLVTLSSLPESIQKAFSNKLINKEQHGKDII